MTNKFFVPLLPGQALTFTFSFSADWENRIDILDQGNNLVLSVNIDDPKPYHQLDIPRNDSGAVTVYAVAGFYKMKRDGRWPWWNSKGSMTRPSDHELLIGFQDQDHGNVFTNAIALATYS
jgi:hypothetical protein